MFEVKHWFTLLDKKSLFKFLKQCSSIEVFCLPGAISRKYFPVKMCVKDHNLSMGLMQDPHIYLCSHAFAWSSSTVKLKINMNDLYQYILIPTNLTLVSNEDTLLDFSHYD